MLLRAIPGAEGGKGAYYCKINILLGWEFNVIPCSLLSGGSHLGSWGLHAGDDPGLRREPRLCPSSVSPFFVKGKKGGGARGRAGMAKRLQHQGLG